MYSNRQSVCIKWATKWWPEVALSYQGSEGKPWMGLEPMTSRLAARSHLYSNPQSPVFFSLLRFRCYQDPPTRQMVQTGSSSTGCSPNRAVGRSKTPVGVEPTWTGLQPVAVPSGSSVISVAYHEVCRRPGLSSKSSRRGSRRQKRPDLKQQLLNGFPLPHGQGSFRPSRSSRSLPPWTIRTPRLTCVSEGNPFRRLLIVSKKRFVVEITSGHGTPPFGSRLQS